jgi:hypothetical protein
MDMAILLHDGLIRTYRTSICHVLPYGTTGQLVGPAKKVSLSEQFLPFRWFVLPAAGKANRWAAVK